MPAPKRYRHLIWQEFNLGGDYQFEDGFYPPLSEPPIEDEGIQYFFESHPQFGKQIIEVGLEPEKAGKPQPTLEDRDAMIAKAEAKVEELGLGFPTKPVEAPMVPDEPEEEEEAEDAKPELPSKKFVGTAKKVQLLELIDKFDLPVNPEGLGYQALKSAVRGAMSLLWALDEAEKSKGG